MDAPVSLEEFFNYLTNEKQNIEKWDPHWKPLSLLGDQCGFCEIDYDYVIKLEHISIELPFVLSTILNYGDNGQQLPLLTPNDQVGRKVKTEYLKTVPTDLILKVVAIFEDDYKAFGYSFPTTAKELETIYFN